MNTVFVWVGYAALAAAGLWWAAVIASWIFAPLLWRLSPPASACTNGFAIYVPDYWYRVLTPAEIQAVLAHERGHIARRHNWINLALALAFWPTGEAHARRQEHEADDHAGKLGHGPAMASSLLKLSWNPFDVGRARRLMELYAVQPNPPGDPWAFRPSEPSADLASPGETDESLPEVPFDEPQDVRQEFPGAMRGLWPHRSEHQRQGQGHRALG